MATNKSIQDMIFKSRLTIKYRTEISGTPVDATLPFRVLVLGDLSGKSAHHDGFHGDLADRAIWSIKKGMNPDHLLQTLGFSLKVSADKLKSQFPGTLRCGAQFTKENLKLPRDSSGELSRPLKVAPDTIRFSSLKTENGVTDISTCEVHLKATLRFSTIAGDVDKFLGVTFTLRGRVFGEQVDPATSKVINRVSGRIMVDIDPEIALAGASPTWTGTIPGGGTITVKQSETDPTQFNLTISDQKVVAERTIPILDMDSFTPDAVATSLPELRRLFLIKQLLQELKAEIQSRPDLRKALSKKLKDSPDEIKELNKRLQIELPELKI